MVGIARLTVVAAHLREVGARPFTIRAEFRKRAPWPYAKRGPAARAAPLWLSGVHLPDPRPST